MSERDLDEQPYSPDEQRVAKFFFDRGTGGGDDPIGALIASHEYLAAERNELRIQVERQRSAVQLAIDWFLTSKPEVKNMNQPQLIDRLRAALSSDERA